MVISSRNYDHLKISYNPQQLNDGRSTFFFEDVRCKFFENNCVVKNRIAIKNTKWIFFGKEKLRGK